jgi:hypothetical protein
MYRTLPALLTVSIPLSEIILFKEPEPGPGEFVGDDEREFADRLILASLAVHIKGDVF